MERRQMLKYLFAGGVSATLSAPAIAQQGAPRPQSQPPKVAANSGAARPDGNIIVTTPAELESILREWEQKTSSIERLRGGLLRYEYDDVFGVDKRAVGEFWYEAPDKGRIDFKPAPTTDPETGKPLVSPKKDAQGVPYRVEAEDAMTWNCDGKSIFQVEHAQKTYGLAEIPPQHQGENIMDGPLPFLFGMKAEKIKKRYRLTLGSQNNKKGNDGREKYHIVAAPNLQSDARNWQRAEVILDAEFCLPTAIRLIDPAGSKETVYVFLLSGSQRMKANEKIWFPDPFKLSLRGFKLVETQVAAPAGANQGNGVVPAGAVQPVRGGQPAGKATLPNQPGKSD